jgi:hypothetical protein
MTRWKAAGIHVLCSVGLALFAAVLVFGIWFPPPYFHASGGDRLIVILIGVDLVVGPLLTLIVFKSGKWGMKFDLAVIAIVQVAALAYGLSVITTSRPAFIVATVGRFAVVPANAVEYDLPGTPREYQSPPWFGPRLVSAQIPRDAKAREEVMNFTLAGKDIDRLPKYYAPIEAIEGVIRQHAKPLSKLIAQDAQVNRPVIERALHKLGRSLDMEKTGYLPIIAPRGELVMLIDRESGKALGPVDLPSTD